MASYQSQYNLTSGSFDVIALNGATPNLPVLTDADSNLTTGQIDLKTQVSGVLPTANGGTGASLALAGGKLIVSSGAALAEGTSSTTPTFAGMNLSGLSPSTWLGLSSSNDVESRTLSGTANRVTVSNIGTAYTLSGPQDIATTSSPSFAGMSLTALTNYTGDTGGSNPPINAVVSLDLTNTVRKTSVAITATAASMVQRDKFAGISAAGISGTSLGLSSVSNQIACGAAANTTTLNLAAPVTSCVVTIPDPGSTAASVVLTEAAQTVNGNKTLTGTTTLSAVTASLPLKANASKNITSGLIVLTSEVTGVLPVANGGSTGTNTGDLTLAAVGSAPNANGASLAGQVLTIQPASSSQPGAVTTGTQSFGGTKTFTSLVSAFLGLSGATNQIGVDGGAVTTFINIPAPAGNRTITVPDSGTANAGCVLTESAQTVNGVKTLASGAVIGTTGTTVGLTLNNSTVSYSPAVLNHYETYSANVNLAGAYTATQVLAIKIVRVGAHVTLTYPTLLAATSVGANIQGAAGDVPARFAPAANLFFPVMVQSNTVNAFGTLTVETNGRLTFNNAAFQNFTGAGNGGPYGSAVSWQI